MRKIKPTTAYSKISSIRTHVLENILEQKTKGSSIDFSLNKYLKRIESLTVNKKDLIALIQLITQADAKKCLKLSILQDKEIKNSIFSVSKKTVPDSIVNLVEFIYEKILFYPTYWNTLNEWTFSKMEFKKIFFKSQNHYVCPYCDSKEEWEVQSFQIDHLLPKSEFPLLYINESNLFPCCISCNDFHHGKGNNWNEKYYNLFKNTIGLKVKFEFEPKFKIIWKDNISNDFLNLIQIKERAKSEWFCKKIINLKKKIRKDLKKDKTNRTHLDISAPNYFLIKTLYSYLSKIF